MKRSLRKKPDSYHHGNLRAALMEAATAVAASHGVEAVNLRDLTRRMGVSSAAPFRHFADRNALLLAVAEEGVAKFQLRAGEAASRESDPVEQARARGIAYVRFAVEEPGYFRVMHHPEIIKQSASIVAAGLRNRDALDRVLGVHQPGQASPDLARRTAGTLAAQALTYGLARMLMDGLLGDVSAEDAARLAHELTGVLGEGLRGATP